MMGYYRKLAANCMVCMVLTFVLYPKTVLANNLSKTGFSPLSEYITIIGAVFLALIVFGLIIYNNFRNIHRLNRENKSMQKLISNYEVANKVFGSIFFEGSHETNELHFDGNYSTILGREPYYKRLSDFGQHNPYVYPDDLVEIARFGQNLQKGAKYASAEFRYIMQNGSLVWHKIEAQTFFELSGKPASIVGRIININNQKLEMLRLQQIASSDSLTGLLSNRPAKDAIKEFLSGEGKAGTHALYLIDLDNFHDVNYMVGHFTGDAILSKVAEKLKAQFDENDIFARIGGDEFIVLQKNVASIREIREHAENVVKVLSYRHDENLEITCSVGVSVVKNGNKDIEALFREADIAMFSAKGLGKGRHVVFPYKDDNIHLSEQDTEILQAAEKYASSPIGSILKYVSGGIVKLEVDSRIRMTYASEGFYRLKTTKSKKMRYVWDEFFFSIHKADRENVLYMLQNARETGKAVDVSFRIYNKYLNFVWYNLRAVRNGENKSEVIAIISDVTPLLSSNIQLDYLLS